MKTKKTPFYFEQIESNHPEKYVECILHHQTTFQECFAQRLSDSRKEQLDTAVPSSFPQLFFLNCIYLFVFGCASLLLGFSLAVGTGGSSLVVVWASHCGGFACCASLALGRAGMWLQFPGSRAQGQQPWHTGW